MYLENDTKFYEISWIKGAIYIHFGKIPDMDARLPFGTVKKIRLKIKIRENIFNNKINEKLKKGYELIKDGVGASSNMKEMIKLKKL